MTYYASAIFEFSGDQWSTTRLYWKGSAKDNPTAQAKAIAQAEWTAGRLSRPDSQCSAQNLKIILCRKREMR